MGRVTRYTKLELEVAKETDKQVALRRLGTRISEDKSKDRCILPVRWLPASLRRRASFGVTR